MCSLDITTRLVDKSNYRAYIKFSVFVLFWFQKEGRHALAILVYEQFCRKLKLGRTWQQLKSEGNVKKMCHKKPMLLAVVRDLKYFYKYKYSCEREIFLSIDCEFHTSNRHSLLYCRNSKTLQFFNLFARQIIVIFKKSSGFYCLIIIEFITENSVRLLSKSNCHNTIVFVLEVLIKFTSIYLLQRSII